MRVAGADLRQLRHVERLSRAGAVEARRKEGRGAKFEELNDHAGPPMDARVVGGIGEVDAPVTARAELGVDRDPDLLGDPDARGSDSPIDFQDPADSQEPPDCFAPVGDGDDSMDEPRDISMETSLLAHPSDFKEEDLALGTVRNRP